MTLFSPTQVVSSRPEGRALCGPQRRDLLFPSSSVLLGSPSDATQTHDLEGAPSFAPFAKGGFLGPNASDSLLLALAFLSSSSALSLRTLRLCVICIFFFLSTFDFHLPTQEPQIP